MFQRCCIYISSCGRHLSAIEEIVTKVRESDKDRLVTILIDSLAAASTKVEMDADFDKDGWEKTGKIIISKVRKITQMIGRQNILGIYKPTQTETRSYVWRCWTTSGGKPYPFHDQLVFD